jgi:cytochrome c oxidase subunit II
MTTRSARRARAADTLSPEQAVPQEEVRLAAFGVVVVAVLLAGAWLAFGDFLHRGATVAGATQIQSSMAGFTPSEIHVRAGQTATFEWWTDDAAVHLENGVHTMISPQLGLDETLPAEGRRAVTWQVPDRPGTYDVYCDSCCGGKDSPTMHGKIVVEA